MSSSIVRENPMNVVRNWLDSRVDFSGGGGSSARKRCAPVRQNEAHFGAFRGSPKGAPNCAIFWRTSAKIDARCAAPQRRKSIGSFWPAGQKSGRGGEGESGSRIDLMATTSVAMAPGTLAASAVALPVFGGFVRIACRDYGVSPVDLLPGRKSHRAVGQSWNRTRHASFGPRPAVGVGGRRRPARPRARRP